MFRDDVFPGELARAEAQGGAQAAEALRIFKALVDAQDGRLLDALDALARLAAERPDSNSPRLCAAAVCDLLGRVDEGDRWLAGIHCPLDHSFFNLALVAATLGGAPGAVAGSQGRVASAALRIINTSVSDGQMSAFLTIIIGLLKHAAKRRCKDPPLKHGDGVLPELDDAFALSGSLPKGPSLFVLDASQALLSAVVLRAHTLSGERVSTALRVSERDLARAVELGDAAAVADLRLLLAFLAARAGRFDEALARYEAVARDDPSDPRPHFLSVLICVHVSRPKEESDKWRASNRHLAQGSSFRDSFALMTLTEELLVALALASPTAFDVRNPVRMRSIVGAAGSTVDAALVSALRSKNMSIVEWMEVRAVRALLYAGMWSALKDWEREDGGSY
ncbi:hypothetical protein PVAP13_5NG226048 [Panicum virgatum]|uniref:Uncharacterized protein n=1 Tax=Panicum virgatum TaxID=38727 RepID=A0A8T0RRV2_PANVG|nr:hypothetical protein PVAP13_5NG226048 [Panicum virgatum]